MIKILLILPLFLIFFSFFQVVEAPSHPIGVTPPPECRQTLYFVEGFGDVCGDPALASVCRTFGMDSHVLCPRVTEENPIPVQTITTTTGETGLTMSGLMILTAIGVIVIIGIIIFRRRKR